MPRRAWRMLTWDALLQTWTLTWDALSCQGHHEPSLSKSLLGSTGAPDPTGGAAPHTEQPPPPRGSATSSGPPLTLPSSWQLCRQNTTLGDGRSGHGGVSTVWLCPVPMTALMVLLRPPSRIHPTRPMQPLPATQHPPQPSFISNVDTPGGHSPRALSWWRRGA